MASGLQRQTPVSFSVVHACTDYSQPADAPVVKRARHEADPSTDARIIIFGGRNPNGKSALMFMMRLNTPNHQWVELESMPTDRQYGVAAALGPDRKLVLRALRQVPALTHFPPGIVPLMAAFLGPEFVLLAGGIESGQASLDCPTVRYSLENGSWDTDLSPSPPRRYWATATVIADQMLVCGGSDAATNLALASCEAFDPTTNCWTSLPPMSTPRTGHCAAEWQGRVFVFGGRSGDSRTASSCECYDPTLRRWSPLTPLNRARNHAAAVAMAGSGILVLGGCDVEMLQTAELYDPTTHSWSTFPWILPKPISNFSAHYTDSKLYIAGGYIGGVLGGCTAEVWVLDLALESPAWAPLPPLPTPLFGTASVLV